GDGILETRLRNSMNSQTSPRVMNEQMRSDRIGLWIALGLGALLMLAAALAGAEEGVTLKRTDRFNATLPAGSTLRIENVSGDVVASAGRNFSAVVTVTVTAPTKARAEELLRSTTVTQRREDDELSLRSEWPYSDKKHWKSSRTWDANSWGRYWYRDSRCDDCKITAQYEVTVPAGVRAILHTVNGEVRTDGPDADLDLQSVNGSVSARGARRGVCAQTVNGKIDVAMHALASSAPVQAKPVKGSVLVTRPKDARFDVSPSTMNGMIPPPSPLPPQPGAAEAPEPPRPPAAGESRTRPPRRVVV